MLIFSSAFWMMNFKNQSSITRKSCPMSSSMTMTPKHKGKKAQKWLQDSGFEILVWSPQWADVHPFEHLWHHLKTRLEDCKRQSQYLHSCERDYRRRLFQHLCVRIWYKVCLEGFRMFYRQREAIQYKVLVTNSFLTYTDYTQTFT